MTLVGVSKVSDMMSHSLQVRKQNEEMKSKFDQAEIATYCSAGQTVEIFARAITKQNIVFVGDRSKYVTIRTIGSRPYVPETSHVIIDRQRTDRTADNKDMVRRRRQRSTLGLRLAL